MEKKMIKQLFTVVLGIAGIVIGIDEQLEL